MRVAHRTGIAVLVMAAGVLLISVAYASGRNGSSWIAAYWAGEALVFGPLVWRVFPARWPSSRRASSRRVGEGEAVVLVLAIATATYLIKFCYSPAAFRFPDELEHWRTTVNLLTTHHLFGPNYLLPVSPSYPGLEEVTGALVSLTGMPVFAAGLIVAGLAHLLFTIALYLMFRLVSRSPWLALTGCAIYATNPHYQVFDAIYGYQTLALAFFVMVLVAAFGAQRGSLGVPGTRRVWLALAVTFTAATVVTHHITSYVLAATLLLLVVVGVLRERWNQKAARVAAGLAAVCAGLVGLWAGLVATGTAGYLTPALHSFTDGVAGAFGGHTAAGGEATPAGPFADQLAGYAATALIMIAVPFGWWRIWRTRRRDTWALALGLGAVAYYVLALLRVTAPDGAELAGRALTFAYIPVSYTLAMALTTRPAAAGTAGAWAAGARWGLWHTAPAMRGQGHTRPRRGQGPGHTAPAMRGPGHTRPRRGIGARARVLVAGTGVAGAGVVVGAGILVAGGIASGWPPYWERLPGRYVVDGFESGITPEGIAAAKWARAELGPGQRIAADYTNYLLLGSYGEQNPVGNLDGLYCGPQWTPVNEAVARQQEIAYLLVDLRMSEQKAVTGGYFTDASPVCPSPIPRQYLTKFDAVPGFDRVYDSGNIVIYALPEAGNAP